MSKKIFTVYPTALVVIFSVSIRILNHLNVWLDTVHFILIVGLMFNLNGVIRTGFGIANFRYNFVKMLGNMFNIPCAFASFYLKFANSKIL